MFTIRHLHVAITLLLVLALNSSAQSDRASQVFEEAVRLHGAGTPASLEEAIKKYLEAIKFWEGTGKELEQARAKNNLAAIYFRTGELDKAIRTFQDVLEIFERKHGSQHIEIFKTLNNMAMVYAAKGDNPNADAMYDRAFPIYEKTLGITEEYLKGLNDLGYYYRNERRFDRAVRMFEKVLSIDERQLKPDDPDLAITLTNVAVSYLELGEFAKAEPLYQRALALRQRVFGSDSVEAALSLNNFAALYSAKNDLARAEEFDKRALAILEKKLGAEDAMVGHTLSDLGMINSRKKNFSAAEDYFKRALKILEKAHGHNAMELSGVLQNYARMLNEAGRAADAEKVRQRLQSLTPN